MQEYLIIASLMTSAISGYRTLFPVKPQPYVPPMAQTSPASPRTTMQHITSADGDGPNAIVNLSIVNNSSDGSSSSYESTRQYIQQKLNVANFSDVTNSICNYCSDNKYSLAALGIVVTYAYLFYKVNSIHSYINNALAWSAWKRDVSFELLLAIPQDHLTQDLMTVIQTRYMSCQNPTDFLTPLISFSKDIAQEQELVTHYHTFITWCMRCNLNAILPISDTLLCQLTERRQRIIYINTLFQSWLAQYKLQQITR